MAANGVTSGGLRKALFRSPPIIVESPTKNPEALETLLNKIQVDIEVDNNRNSLRREMHEQRLCKLRQELERISQDQWKYKSVDQLIGF